MSVVEEKEKLTPKQVIRREWRRLLYFPEDYAETEQKLNPENQVVVFGKQEEPKTIIVENEDDDGISVEEEYVVLESKKANVPEGAKKTFKDRWFEFLNYKATVEPMNEIEKIQYKVNRQMDIIVPEKRANDFLVVGDKIYVLCSDDYMVYVYDRTNNVLINSFELDHTGYYNAIRVSNDKKVGIITNISSNAITLFDTNKDAVIQKLPISVNVHNVVITGKE